MTDRHPDRKALEQFLDGGLPEGESRILQRHLFLCPICEDRMIALLPGSAASPHPAAADDGYRGLIQRLLNDRRTEVASRHHHLARERQLASGLWREIEPLSPERRRALIRRDPRFQIWALFELLVDLSRQAVLDDPGRAEELLGLALDVVERVSPLEYGPGSTEAAKARAWTWRGNAWRVRGDFRQAEKAFQTAEVFLAQSWVDPLDEALLLELKAPLRRAQGRFDEALELLAEAIAIYREVNEPHLQGRALMVNGLVLRYQGNLQGAADCFRTSLFLLDGTREPRLVVTSQYNLIGCLEASGRGAEAAALIPEAKKLIEQTGTRSDLIRLRWTEGRVAVLLERPADAEAALLEVRESFVAEERAFDAAQVSLELAALYLHQGRSEETQLLAAELIPIFQSRDVYREALAAVLVFQQAAAMEQLTAGLVEEIAAYLEKVWMQVQEEENGRATIPLLDPMGKQRDPLPESSSRVNTDGFLELMVERSLAVSLQDPRRGEEWGRLALRVADSLDAGSYGAERLEDLRARTLAYVGNARRIQSDLKDADRTFRQALVHLRRGTGALLELAIFLDLLASLRRSQRRFQESFRLLRKAVSVFLDLGDRHRAGRSLVNLSAGLLHAGRAEECVPVLYRALDLVDEEQEPRVLLSAKHNLIAVLTETGRFLEAQGAYRETRSLYLRFPDAKIQNRRIWLKGRIARGMGQIGEAESLFLTARDGFMAEDIPYETALVSLDLALLYAEQGRTAELKGLAAELVPIFASRQIHREALMALTFLQRTIEAEGTSIEVVERVAEYLHQARYRPDLPFQEFPQ
jgi:tetratricopeptide (TPR) repeat protein